MSEKRDHKNIIEFILGTGEGISDSTHRAVRFVHRWRIKGVPSMGGCNAIIRKV